MGLFDSLPLMGWNPINPVGLKSPVPVTPDFEKVSIKAPPTNSALHDRGIATFENSPEGGEWIYQPSGVDMRNYQPVSQTAPVPSASSNISTPLLKPSTLASYLKPDTKTITGGLFGPVKTSTQAIPTSSTPDIELQKIAQGAAQGFARSAVSVGGTVATALGATKNTQVTPQGKLESFLFGPEPIRSEQSQLPESIAAHPNIPAPALAVGLAAGDVVNLIPFFGEEKGAALFLKSAQATTDATDAFKLMKTAGFDTHVATEYAPLIAKETTPEGVKKITDAAVNLQNTTRAVEATGNPAAKTLYDTPAIIAERERQAGIPITADIQTPERVALRQSILDKSYGTGAVNKNKRLDLVVGGPGTRKSSMIADQLAKTNGSLIADSDKIKRQLPEFGANGEGTTGVHLESARITKGLMDKGMQNGDNIVYTTVGDNINNLNKVIDNAKTNGYDVHLHGVTLPHEKSVPGLIDRWSNKEQGFVDPHFVINKVGSLPEQNYAKLVGDERLTSQTKYSTDVTRGQQPDIIHEAGDLEARGRVPGSSEGLDSQGNGRVSEPPRVDSNGGRGITKTENTLSQEASQTAESSLLPSQQERPQIQPDQVPLPKAVSYAKDLSEIANSELNLDHLNVSDESKNIIQKTVDEVKPEIEKAVGKKLSNAEALAQAERTSKVLSRTIGRQDTLDWEASMLKARQGLAAAAESGTVDQAFIDNLLTIKTQGTDIARKLQSLSIGADAIKPTPAQAIIEAVLDVNKNTDEVLKVAKGVNFNNLNEATNFYRQFIKPKAGEWLDLIRYNSMLSSPKTHIINVFSNLVNTAMVAPLEKALTGGLDFIGSKITGNARAAFAGEGGVYLKHYLTNVREAASRFAEVMSGNREYTNLDTRNIPIATSGVKGAVVSALSEPMKLLEGMDQFFTALAEGGQKGALDYRVSKGVNVGNIESKAQADAAYRLFRQKPMDESQGHVLDAIDQVTLLMQRLRNNKNPIVSTIAKFTVPFLQTPMNIFKQGVEYSPLGITTLAGAKNKTEQLSKAIIGSSVFAGAATLLASNRLTWGEPVDSAGKSDFRASGMQAYSVKIGDTWYSYQKLPPGVAFPLAMTAAIHDTLANKKIDDNTADLVLGGIAKYGQFLSDQSYAKSIGDLLASAQGGEAGIAKVASNYVQQLVPYRALGGWLARLTDPIQRKVDTTQSFVDQQVQLLMMNFPVLSEKTPARTDATGKPIPQPYPIANAFSPVNVTGQSLLQEENYQNILDLKQRNKNETQISAQKQQQAVDLDQLLQTMPKDEANAKVTDLKTSDPELYAKLRTVVANRTTVLTREEQLMKSLGVVSGERAKYINDQIMKLPTSAERNAYLKELQDKKLVTTQVYEQLKQLAGK